MIWLTWRQQRMQTGAVLAAVLAIGIAFLATAHGVRRLAHSSSVYDVVSRSDRHLFYVGIVVVAIAPVLLGALWGAPLVAREFEAGTHRVVWAQSVTRTRWLAVRLGGLMLGAAVAIGLLTAVVTWWSGPLDGVRSQTVGSLPARLTPVAFGMRGLVPVGYAVLAVALGVLLGLLLRRTLVAVVLTLVFMTIVQIAEPLWIRPHLAPPVTLAVALTPDDLGTIDQSPSGAVHLSVAADPRAWVLENQTVDRSGHAAALPSWFAACLPQPDSPSTGVTRVQTRGTLDACVERLTTDGYHQRVVEQPANRFWQLQWTETGLYLVAAAGLTIVTFRRIRRVE